LRRELGWALGQEKESWPGQISVRAGKKAFPILDKGLRRRLPPSTNKNQITHAPILQLICNLSFKKMRED
jgi:hypothetical protein